MKYLNTNLALIKSEKKIFKSSYKYVNDSVHFSLFVNGDILIRLDPALNSQYSVNINFTFDSVRHSGSYSIILTQIVLI